MKAHDLITYLMRQKPGEFESLKKQHPSLSSAFEFGAESKSEAWPPEVRAMALALIKSGLGGSPSLMQKLANESEEISNHMHSREAWKARGSQAAIVSGVVGAAASLCLHLLGVSSETVPKVILVATSFVSLAGGVVSYMADGWVMSKMKFKRPPTIDDLARLGEARVKLASISAKIARADRIPPSDAELKIALEDVEMAPMLLVRLGLE